MDGWLQHSAGVRVRLTRRLVRTRRQIQSQKHFLPACLDGWDRCRKFWVWKGSHVMRCSTWIMAPRLSWIASMRATVGPRWKLVMEHPGPPAQTDRASVWTMMLTELSATPLHHFHVLSRRRWGAKACKPTGFLPIGLPKFWQSMWACQIPDARCPKSMAIGVNEAGCF